jgi:sucrose phosphorylase
MIMSSSDTQFQKLSSHIYPLLKLLYGEETATQLVNKIFDILKPDFAASNDEDFDKWNQNNVQVITYGGSIIKAGEVPLKTLRHFLNTYLKDTITGVHILPFFPYSSDDGFAVIDYLKVDPKLGDWPEIEAIANDFNLMVDLVLNHVSRESEWFKQYQEGKPPGRNYFIEVDPTTDLSQVVRPRSTPLLVEVDTVNGKKHLWATFSEDQIDVNFANSDVLLEYIKIIDFYVRKGTKYIRLDAVGFLWKKIGTSCMHLPETHAAIRIIREILQFLDPSIALITETNVPNRENLSYFGNRNEAHMIYNFSLPPLVLNALLQGKSEHLKTWMMSMPPAPRGCAFFNFLASHDGIGLRPTEGLLTKDEYNTLLQKMQDFGGKISMRKKPDGDSPYEINISWFDAMKGTAKGEDQWQIERFLCSQTIMLALEGIPAFYIHSLLATANDVEGVEKTKMNRTINRYKWDYKTLQSLLDDPNSCQSIILKELSQRIKIRRKQPAFHPNATQYTLHPLNLSLFVFWRQSIYREQSIFCINNLSDQVQELSLSNINLVLIDPWKDLLSGKSISDLHDTLILQPYQCVWLTNYFEDSDFLIS